MKIAHGRLLCHAARPLATWASASWALATPGRPD